MTISQRSVRARRIPGKPGQAYDLSAEELDFTNDHPQAAQVSTATVNAAVDESDEFTLTVNGIELTITAGAADDKESIADALAEAVNEDPVVRANVSAESDNTDTVTLTGILPGIPFTLEVDGKLTKATTTNAAKAAPIPFGRLCVRGGASELDVYPNRMGRLPNANDSDLDDLSLGISLFTYDSEEAAYGPNERVAAIKRGRVWVECYEDVSEADDVYVGVDSGEEGRLFKVGGGNRVKLTSRVCRFFKGRPADGLAVVECNFT